MDERKAARENDPGNSGTHHGKGKIMNFIAFFPCSINFIQTVTGVHSSSHNKHADTSLSNPGPKKPPPGGGAAGGSGTGRGQTMPAGNDNGGETRDQGGKDGAGETRGQGGKEAQMESDLYFAQNAENADPNHNKNSTIFAFSDDEIFGNQGLGAGSDGE